MRAWLAEKRRKPTTLRWFVQRAWTRVCVIQSSVTLAYMVLYRMPINVR